MNTLEKTAGDLSAACAVIVRETRENTLVLAVWNRSHNCWGLPGGKRSPEDPSIRATLVRELIEEVNAYVVGCDLVWLGSGAHYVSNTSPRQVHVYYVPRATGPIKMKETSTILAWLEWDWLLDGARDFHTFYREQFPNGIAHLRSTEFQ